MASNPPVVADDPCNTETDEETIALRKKLSRRVSFADCEITSIHIFNRDEDFETPPDSSAKKPSPNNVSQVDNEVFGFFRDLADTDDSKEMSPTRDEDEDDEIGNGGRPFLRPIESPSPGSSIVGSATSNDEDKFFGTVSANFIRPGRLSDSAASDDKHDVTMDSTEFSLHYRSLARSDSGGNIFEEKTPSHITSPSDSGSFMVLTKVKKMSPQFSLPSQKVSSGRDSNDMSLVGENPHNYGYAELSSTLEGLLAEGSKGLQDITASDPMNEESLKRSQASVLDENLSGQINQRDLTDKEIGNVRKLGLSPGDVSAVCLESDKVNGNTLADQITSYCSSRGCEDFVADKPVDLQIQAPKQLSKLQEDSNCMEDLNRMNALIVKLPSGDHHSINGEVLQLDSSVEHESRKDPIRNSHENNRDNYVIYRNFDQQQKSPVPGSISSVSAKQQHIYLDTAYSRGQLLYITPSPKHSTSFVGKHNIKSGDKFLSINKSSSKFPLFEPSPLASALKDGIERSKLRLSNLLSSTTFASNSVAEESCESIESGNVDAVVADLEKCLSSVDQKNRHHETTDCMDRAGIQEKEKDVSVSKTDGTKSLVENWEPSIPMSTLIFFEGTNQLTMERNKDGQCSLMPEMFSKQAVVVSGSDSSSLDFKLDGQNDVKTIILPDKFVSPPAKTLGKMLSTEQPSTPLNDLQSDELLSGGLGQNKSPIAKSTDNSNSSDELTSSYAGDRAQSSSSLMEINSFGDFNQMDQVHNGHTYSPALLHSSECFAILRSPLGERDVKKSLAGSAGLTILFATDRVHSKEEVVGQRNEASLPAPASLDINRRIMSKTAVNKSPFKKEMTKSPIKELTHSPSRKDPLKVLNNENVQSLAEKIIVSPNSTANGPGGSDSPLNRIPGQNFEKSSERKRRFEESVADDADHPDIFRRIKRSPDIHQSQDSVLESTGGSDSTRKMARSAETMKHWSDVVQKFLSATEQLLSPSTGKLNIRSISLLQDIVIYLQKINIFEMLSSQIQCQKMCDQSSEIRHNRVAETKMLLYKLAYEKARLQLLSIKREKVRKRAQQLSSAVHKSQMLKLNKTCLLLPGDRDYAVDSIRHTSNMKLAREKFIVMKHDFEVLDRKIKNLTKVLHSYCKIKREPSCSETVALLNNHLKKKTLCKIIHEDLQLWEVEDFRSMNLKRNIVLNYRGLISQRFVVTDGPTPSVFISNNLDDVNITKNFPNMDACTAFPWVLNAKTPKKLAGFKSLAQEAQTTCSLLHTLLDVIGEVQLALLEIKNLVHASFHSYFVEQLDLQLFLIDSKGRKIMVKLDMKCLNRGVYPSDIIPYRLEASIAGTCMPVPESLSSKITAAAEGLRVGYSRIMRLCRCISQVLLSLST